MNIYVKSVIKKWPFLLLAFLVFSCKSTDDSADKTGDTEEFYLSRPKFIVESPIGRLPYTVKWEENRMVRSYDVQMALNSGFTEGRRHWTTREPFLQLQELPADTVYLRVRSHLNGDYSRWSESLQLISQDGQLQINRVRN
ncbi:MAG: hypothetical protein PQJ50_05600 [Spirochaetales bacterium]|nr:hypothetical protein [Spirochaetales bacterium]